MENNNAAEIRWVTFRSLGRTPRVWQVGFALGAGNAAAILRYAWNHNAEIL